MIKARTISYIVETSVDEMERQILAKKNDIQYVITSAKESRKEFGLKVEELIVRLSSHLTDYEKGMVVEAKEDCLNNFRKGQRVYIDLIKGDEALLDGVAYISLENVRKFFKIIK